MNTFGLNVKPARNQVLASSALPSKLVMLVYLLRHSAYDIIQPDCWYGACEKIIPIMLDSISRFHGCQIEPLYIPHFAEEAEFFEDAGMHPLQDKWSLGDVSLSAAFYDPTKVG